MCVSSRTRLLAQHGGERRFVEEARVHELVHELVQIRVVLVQIVVRAR